MSFIHDHHFAYTPLHYVLLFPFGTAGWMYGLSLKRTQNHRDSVDVDDALPDFDSKHMMQAMFYSFRLHTHENEFPILHLGGRLFQQYVCDMWVSTDQNRLR